MLIAIVINYTTLLRTFLFCAIPAPLAGMAMMALQLSMIKVGRIDRAQLLLRITDLRLDMHQNLLHCSQKHPEAPAKLCHARLHSHHPPGTSQISIILNL